MTTGKCRNQQQTNSKKDVGMLTKYTDTREDRGDLRRKWKQACICQCLPYTISNINLIQI